MTDSYDHAYHLLYAKTNPDHPENVHLLLYHLIDVGQVAHVLWSQVLTLGFRQRLAAMLSMSVEETGQWIAFLAALHDLGKAGPAYQKKYGSEQLKKELVNAGFGLYAFGRAFDVTTPHGTVSSWALTSLLPEITNLDERFAYQIAVALGGHHGAWPPPGATDHLDDSKFPAWGEARRGLMRELLTVFPLSTLISPPADTTELNAFITFLSGLVSVADWLGSRNKECFGFIDEPLPTYQYAGQSARNAEESLSDLGWIGWQPDGRIISFVESFSYLPDIRSPRGVQAEVIAAANNINHPALVILEAPTGIGKTEAALYIADRWLQQNSGRGLYVAMPTQATSNQMYGRVGRFLSHRYPECAPLNFHLVHGQAGWQDALKKEVELQSVGDDREGHVVAESWFTPRKRTLLAPFGVGTVDQALLSVLQTNHFFVRLFGLSHKVVLFDEVHAYDAFMNTIFHRLLTWLRAIGSSVIILSATLPDEARRQLVTAYSGQSLPATTVAYPALTIAAAEKTPQIIPLSSPEDHTLEIGWEIRHEPEAIVDHLIRTLHAGGCAAVICNSVARAQTIYHALDEARQAGKLIMADDDLILFHARFPPVWRQAIEAAVLAKFGKDQPEQRPRTAIVVATQVIEQSLDLDFDVMLTDVAPVDLLIQRAGRLHRHHRHERHGHARRLMTIQPPLDPDGLPDFGNDRFIYEPYILLRSYQALRSRSAIQIPGDTTQLIEAVYGEADADLLSPVWQSALAEAQQRLATHRHEAESYAGRQLILAPGNRRLLRQSSLGLDEESPEIHRTFRAQTRDIDPGISLVCLHQRGNSLFLMTNTGQLSIDLTQEVLWHQTNSYLQNTLTIHHRTVINHFLAQLVPPAWRQHSTLRHCRPVIFTNGLHEMNAEYSLRLSRDLGLEIIKKEGNSL